MGPRLTCLSQAPKIVLNYPLTALSLGTELTRPAIEKIGMNAGNFENLIRPDTYQVFLFGCPGNMPFSFALHPWFVINDRGVISRWEVLFRKGACKTSWGHVYQDFFPPFSGIEVVPSLRWILWGAKLVGSVEGEIAKRVAMLIWSAPEMYPFRDRYSLLGPNSNTFAQWVLNAFPEFGVSLPWNAFGNNYR